MFEVGQEVWDTVLGKGSVWGISMTSALYPVLYPVRVKFDNRLAESYNFQGKCAEKNKRSLFFSEPAVAAELFPPKKPSKYQVKAKAVAFEVVELWYNNSYEPLTIAPESEDSVKNYAIKIGDYFFLLGDYNDAIFVCDYEVVNENQRDYSDS